MACANGICGSAGFTTILAKPTGRCNLRCSFCYQDYNDMLRGSRMQPPVLEKLVERACEIDGMNTSLQWIGGESLAAGLDFYEHCEELVIRESRPGRYLNSCIQTNGTLLDSKWISFFKKNPRFLLSLSFEIFPHLQNSLRQGSGRFADSFAVVSRNVAQLNEARVPYGVLTVIERETLEIEPKAWLEQVVRHGIRRIGLQLSYKNVYGKDLSLIARYIDWLDQLFAAQAEYNLSCTDVSDLLLIRESFYLYGLIRQSGIRLGDCHHHESACSNFLVSVDNVGKVFGHCDAFLGVSDDGGRLYEVGNIFDMSFEEIFASSAMKDIRHQLEAGREKCRPCSYFDLCKGGCGFFKSMQAGRIDAGFGDRIESYCAIKIGMLRYVKEEALREVIWRAHRPLRGRQLSYHFVPEQLDHVSGNETPRALHSSVRTEPATLS